MLNRRETILEMFRCGLITPTGVQDLDDIVKFHQMEKDATIPSLPFNVFTAHELKMDNDLSNPLKHKFFRFNDIPNPGSHEIRFYVQLMKRISKIEKYVKAIFWTVLIILLMHLPLISGLF